MSRFNPFQSVNMSRGAPMGRYSHPGLASTWDENTRLCAKHQGGGDGYDSGGAYWGIPGNVFAVWERGFGNDCVIYVRASGRQNAIDKVLSGDF